MVCRFSLIVCCSDAPLEIVVQVLIVFVGGAAFQVTRLGGREWGISLALGFLSIPWGALIHLLPDKPFEIFFNFIRLMPEPEVLPTVKSDYEPWGGAASIVRDNLQIFANIRGRRVRSSSFVLKNRQAQMSTDDQRRMYVKAFHGLSTFLIFVV